MIFVSDLEGNTVGKGENAGFQKPSLVGQRKPGIVREMLFHCRTVS